MPAMTTEPTGIDHCSLRGDAKNPDRPAQRLRRPVKPSEVCIRTACLYMPGTVWINAHREQVQKLVNAFVKTMKFISTPQCATKLPRKCRLDYYGSVEGELCFTPLNREQDDFQLTAPGCASLPELRPADRVEGAPGI